MGNIKSFKKLALVLAPALSIFALVVAVSIVWHDNWMDWDMQRYITQVKLHEAGDFSFSYPHNLLKNWLYTATLILKPLTTTIHPLWGARFLTIVASAASAIFIALTTLSINRSSFWAVFASCLWFLIPGNLFMMTTLEDNAWANAFNSVFLFTACSAAGISLPFVCAREKHTFLWALASGIILAIGINIHQQLAILFWAFIPLILISFDPLSERLLPAIKRIAVSFVVFVVAYFLTSVLQNQIAFQSWEMRASIVRLVDQPYTENFPNLWFFSANESLLQWWSRICLGWKRLLFLNGQTPLIVYYIGMLAISVCLYLLFLTGRRRGTLMCLSESRTLLWLTVAFAVHIPYSLLYEPENPERWDSVMPSMIVAACVTLSYGCRRFSGVTLMNKGILKKLSLPSLVITLLVVATTGSAYQVYEHLRCEREKFMKSNANMELNVILSHLSLLKDTSESHIVLCSKALTRSDMQVRITYFYPKVTVLTLDESLVPVYTSHQLQLRNDIEHKKLPSIEFDDDAHFSAVPEIYQTIVEQKPVFLSRYDVKCIEEEMDDED